MEYLDIINERDEVIGKASRKDAHEKLLLHRVIHIFLTNDKDELLLQFRAKEKKSYPRQWSSSAAGHVDSGEVPEIAAHRELKEELGIDTKLEFIGKEITRDGIENEMVYLYAGKSNGPFTPDNHESEKIEFFGIERLKKEMPGMKTTPHFRKAFTLWLKRT